MADAAAPYFWDSQDHRRAGGEADRSSSTEPARPPVIRTGSGCPSSSAATGCRCTCTTSAPSAGPDSDIAKSENVAWHVATSLLGRSSGLARPGELPSWARVRTGVTDGASAGLLALAYLDVLTPGPLAAGLRVAGTGAIGSDGVVTAVRMVDAKLAAARRAGCGLLRTGRA